MKCRAWVSTLLIVSLGASSLSFAQGYDRHGDRREQRVEQRHGDRRADRRDDRVDHRRDNRFDHRRDDRVDHRRDDRVDHRRDDRAMGNRGDWRERRDHDRYYSGARGPGWRRGGYLPREYRNHQYVVNNWRAHRLSAPPRGYQWVQVGSDYVLAAIATGLIASLILNSQY